MIDRRDSTQVALSQLIQSDVDALPVTRDGAVVGIVTMTAIRDGRSEGA
ncbi:CBS domain-containing protein [Halobaculum roseum]|uniref:CBS domain-containing protein n=1 Tax=Halobaculum roseum TaxID=2175149 RepID=A0ABD5MRA9_9EURY|nr:CBS domain-containing protein [Halobaculum roseum]QZY04572.1 CBS domain-containing protein [Halobaculum roseum]